MASVFISSVMLFSSCALKDGDGRNPDESDPKVMSLDVSDTEDASKLFDGVDDVKGKEVGEHIKLSNDIEVPEYKEIFTFDVEENVSRDDLENRAKEYFKRLFGESYKEGFVSYHAAPEGTPELERMIYAPDNDDAVYASYNGCPGNFTKKDIRFRGEKASKMIGKYDPEKDKSKVMKLKNGECTVEEICRSAYDFFDKEFTGFGDVVPKVTCLREFADTDDPNSPHYCYMTVGLEADGIMIQYDFSPYSYTATTSQWTEMTNYLPLFFDFIFDGKDSIISFRALAEPLKITSKKPADKLLSMKQATDLLDKNIAENLLFTIDKVRLIYCRKGISYGHLDGQDKTSELPKNKIGEFRPTWSFEWESNGIQSLKVDAITGELTIDADQEELNKMYVEQNRKRN